jgi:hypothetical protein
MKRSALILAAFLASLAFVGTASAGAEGGPCTTPQGSGAELEADCKALAEDEKALAEDEAEEAKQKREDEAPSFLKVTVKSFTGLPPGYTYAEPGFAEITSNTPGRDLTVQVDGEGKTWIYNENQRSGDGKIIFPWSCRHPETVYRYAISAGTEPGHILTRSGHFKGASRYRCALLFNLAVREHAEAIRQREAVERKHRREALERQRRFESNCRTVGGTPVTIQTREGPYIVCRSQTGGIVAV